MKFSSASMEEREMRSKIWICWPTYPSRKKGFVYIAPTKILTVATLASRNFRLKSPGRNFRGAESPP